MHSNIIVFYHIFSTPFTASNVNKKSKEQKVKNDATDKTPKKLKFSSQDSTPTSKGEGKDKKDKSTSSVKKNEQGQLVFQGIVWHSIKWTYLTMVNNSVVVMNDVFRP